MRAVIQRVSGAEVTVEGKPTGKCGAGYMILFCAVEGDTEENIELLARKTVNLRVNKDEEGKMNKSILETGGEILCISQFTLAADTRKGNRPSFIKAMEPQTASVFYDKYCEALEDLGVRKVGKGIFGADMKVSLVNDGPVTIILDTDTWKKGDNNEG
ncbi:MAG: D-tyrosyl-tRNA(Tyr) deacylase [Clostridia bacterium]|nr:D-tyrosyl-tRNA(Tyr) deacylase [Clostridia bacterium]